MAVAIPIATLARLPRFPRCLSLDDSEQEATQIERHFSTNVALFRPPACGAWKIYPSVLGMDESSHGFFWRGIYIDALNRIDLAFYDFEIRLKCIFKIVHVVKILSAIRFAFPHLFDANQVVNQFTKITG
ncbi:hypothetical protein Q31b_20330 [Novipirellula aureliae]|uniref:Uncharacterized protein n=1 Tax=Novipirellula aureliae TaxID=2527966 RepID=A0A5C6E2B1_9BACT|nr:hypothetical protein Q31b_20330 [Novipirellula aureliae]